MKYNCYRPLNYLVLIHKLRHGGIFDRNFPAVLSSRYRVLHKSVVFLNTGLQICTKRELMRHPVTLHEDSTPMYVTFSPHATDLGCSCTVVVLALFLCVCITFTSTFPSDNSHSETPPGENQSLFARLTVRTYVWIAPDWTLQQSMIKSTERQVQQIAYQGKL